MNHPLTPSGLTPSGPSTPDPLEAKLCEGGWLQCTRQLPPPLLATCLNESLNIASGVEVRGDADLKLILARGSESSSHCLRRKKQGSKLQLGVVLLVAL